MSNIEQSMIKRYQQIQKNQLKTKKFSELSMLFVETPLKVTGDLVLSHRTILDVILRLSQSFSTIFVSQSTIGRLTGYTRQTVNEAIGELEFRGLLKKAVYYRRPNMIQVHPRFHEYSYRKMLMHYLPSLMMASFLMLFSKPAPDAVKENDPTLYLNNKDCYLTKPVSIPVSLPDPVYLESDTRARARGQVQVTVLEQKKGNVMLQKRVSALLNLTPIGEELLSCFSEEALSYGLKQLEKTNLSKLHKPYAWFFVLCREQSNDKGWPVDWGRLKELKMKHNVTHDTPMDNGAPQGTDQVDKVQKRYKMGLTPPPTQPWMSLTLDENMERWTQWNKNHRQAYEDYYGESHVEELWRLFDMRMGKVYKKLPEKGKEHVVPFYGTLSAADTANGIKDFENQQALENMRHFMGADAVKIRNAALLNWLNRSFTVATEADKIAQKFIDKKKETLQETMPTAYSVESPDTGGQSLHSLPPEAHEYMLDTPYVNEDQSDIQLQDASYGYEDPSGDTIWEEVV